MNSSVTESETEKRDDFAALEARTDQLEAETRRKAARIDELEAELAQYRAANEQDKAAIRRNVHDLVEVRTDDDNNDADEDNQLPALEDVWIAGQPLGKIINGIQTKVDQHQRHTSAQSSESAPIDESMTPMERVLRFDQHGVTADVTASVRRAQTIAEHYKKWASKTIEGYVIRDNLLTLLNTARRDEEQGTLIWNQVYRSCEKLEEYTKGAIRFEKHRKHGWILVAEPAFTKHLDQLVNELEKERVRTRDQNRKRSSSVNGG